MRFDRTSGTLPRTPASYRIAAVLLLTLVSPVHAQPESGPDEEQDEAEQLLFEGQAEAFDFGTIRVMGQRQSDQNRVSGATSVIGERTLERDEYDDIHRILGHVPGVYIRGEEGYGLRPNIGLRGATTERSQKIALLEDGVLIGPAPYSAPAAYYFPMMSRMTGVEVVKGPAAIAQGPNTVGGALNVITRPVPPGREVGVDLAAGSNGYGRTHAYAGDGSMDAGWLVEGLHVRTDGFKELDGGGDTGFEKSNLMLRGRLNPEFGNGTHRFDLKLNVADEVSDETYLGLSDDDFARTPVRRYRASALDRMEWRHNQIQLRHHVELAPAMRLESVVYNHDFTRDWFKLNRFDTNRSLGQILANPDAGLNQNFMAVLRGDKDSEVADETLMLGSNDRSYYSRGIQSVLHRENDWFGLPGDLTVGMRYHEDQVRRNHTEDGYVMAGGNLVNDGDPVEQTVLNRESAEAFSAWIRDEIRIDALTLSAGLRLEQIDYRSEDDLAGTITESDNSVLLPGLGAFYSLTDELGVFAGVHQGFVPTGPRQPDTIEPEESTNYELGLRYQTAETQLELVGFYNDYSNLKGTCTFSSGCDDAARGEPFSGGAVEVYGLESSFARVFDLPGEWRVPLDITYTFTETGFLNEFDSDFPLWGNVETGDRLPYMPRHQASLSLGLDAGPWAVTANVRHVGEQEEQAGEGGPLEGATVPAHTVVDLVGQYFISTPHTVYLKVDNLADESYLISRRPFGARPGKPRTVELGYKYRF